MARANQFVNATRTVRVPLVFEEEGERKSEDFSVVYRAFSPKVAREMRDVEKDEGNRSLAKSLAAIVVSIPEIFEGEQPMSINEDNLEQMSSENLIAIYEAVTKDVQGPTQGRTDKSASAPSLVTSPPAANRE
jgi:hypothetical protein